MTGIALRRISTLSGGGRLTLEQSDRTVERAVYRCIRIRVRTVPDGYQSIIARNEVQTRIVERASTVDMQRLDREMAAGDALCEPLQPYQLRPGLPLQCRRAGELEAGNLHSYTHLVLRILAYQIVDRFSSTDTCQLRAPLSSPKFRTSGTKQFTA